jgi:hypothetical protein
MMARIGPQAAAAVCPGGLLRRLTRLTRAHPRLFLLSLILLAFLPRLPQFATRELWNDEIWQLQISDAPSVAGVLQRVVDEDRNPPGYSVLLHFCLGQGPGEANLRLPSLLAGVASAVVAWWAGRLWLGRGGGIVFALLVAACPPYAFYAREARPYATGLLAVLLFLLAMAWYARRPSWRSAAALAAAGAVCILWQYANAVVVAFGLLAVLAWTGRRLDRARLAGWLAAATACTAMLALMTLAFLKPQMHLRGSGNEAGFLHDYFFTLTSPSALAAFIPARLTEFFDYLFPFGRVAALGPRWKAVGMGLAAGTALVLVAGVVWAIRRPGRGSALLLTALGTLVAFVILAGIGRHPFGGIRHCLPVTPAVLLLAAAGVVALGRRWPLVADGAALLLLGLMVRADCVDVPGWQRQDVKGMLATLRDDVRPGEIVVILGDHACRVVRHCRGADSDQLHLVYHPLPVSEDDEVKTSAAQRAIGAALAEGPVWLVWMHNFREKMPAFERAAEQAGARPQRRVDLPGVHAARWEKGPATKP